MAEIWFSLQASHIHGATDDLGGPFVIIPVTGSVRMKRRKHCVTIHHRYPGRTVYSCVAWWQDAHDIPGSTHHLTV